jgi:ketosteroid isomerase-like protein
MKGPAIRRVSRENVELIQRVYQEFAETGEAVLRALDSDAEWHTAADLPDSDVHHGHEAIAAFVRERVDSFGDFRADIEGFIDRSAYVVGPMVLPGRIHGTEQEVTLPETQVWKVRDGKGRRGPRVPHEGACVRSPAGDQLGAWWSRI